MATKQILLIRRDLKMRRGKEAAQCSHAAMGFLHSQMKLLPFGGNEYNMSLTDEQQDWFSNGTKKVCCPVNSEEEMLAIIEQAKNAGLTTYVVTDEGLTEFGGVHTLTAAAIGPHNEEKFVGITDHLKLY